MVRKSKVIGRLVSINRLTILQDGLLLPLSSTLQQDGQHAIKEKMMRILRISLLCLTLSSFVTFSFADSDDATEKAQENETDVYYIDTGIWGEALDRFKKLVSTDPEGARTELKNVAKTLFAGHILAEEWVPLYFRLSQGGTEHLSDVKRVSELEIRMLTAINAKKYAEQIQHHREIVKRCDELAKTFEKRKPTPPTQTSTKREETPHTENNAREKSIGKRLSAFNKLLPTHPDAARSQLIAAAALMFNEHPLHETWAELACRFSRESQVPILDVARHFEIEIQMFTDIDAEGYAETIADLRQNLKKLNQFINQFERLGIDPKTKTVEYNYKIGRRHSEND